MAYGHILGYIYLLGEGENGTEKLEKRLRTPVIVCLMVAGRYAGKMGSHSE